MEKFRRIVGDCYEEVQRWIKSVGLELADHKTEVVMFTSRKKVETITIDVGQCTTTSQPNVKCLGVMLNTRLYKYAAPKAARVANALVRFMPNVGRPCQPRSNHLASVVTSILTYGLDSRSKPSRLRNIDDISQRQPA